MEINTGKTSSAQKYDEMEGQLKEYMRHKQLPSYMRSRILTYYEFIFQRRYFRESEILSTISEQLRQVESKLNSVHFLYIRKCWFQEMNMHACRKLVENVIFFRNLPLNLLVRIISCLRIEVFLVNDVIIRVNTPGSSMYFISTGTVAIYTKSGKEVRIFSSILTVSSYQTTCGRGELEMLSWNICICSSVAKKKLKRLLVNILFKNIDANKFRRLKKLVVLVVCRYIVETIKNSITHFDCNFCNIHI